MGRWKRGVVALAAVLVLAGCGFGITGPATDVSDITATLTGVADRTEPGGITWWFEYGTTPDYGSTTPRDSRFVTAPIPVSAVLETLSPQTTYHYRLCVSDFEEDRGSCGADSTFTTGTARDHVRGHIEVSSLFQPPFHLGVRLDASSDADGTNPSGGVSAYHDDVTISGTVTCLRIVENRAAIGFLSTEGEPWLAYVFDNGASGDSFDIVGFAGTLTECPQPPAGLYAHVSNFGDVEFIDVT
jgi:hypothetical protein